MIFNTHCIGIGQMSDDNVVSIKGNKINKGELDEIFLHKIFDDEFTKTVSDRWLFKTLNVLAESGIDTENEDFNHDLSIIVQLMDTLIYRHKNQ